MIRQGVDTDGVIQNVKKIIKDKIQPALPEGVQFVTTYDRSELIERAIDTLKDKLIEEIMIVSLVCIVFLWHLRSALVAILTLPLSILLSFVVMRALGIGANLMSLGGIAIAVGDDRRRDHHDRGRTQVHRARHQRPAAPRDPGGGRAAGRAPAVLLAADHHGVVPADLLARGAGGPAVLLPIM